MSDPRSAGSLLLAPIFASGAVQAAFSDLALVQQMLNVERALAEAEAEVGVIPPEAASAIAGACRADLYDLADLGHAAAPAGNVAIPVVKALTAKVPAAARGSVHVGATSQDLIDTAFMLMARDAFRIVRGVLNDAMRALADLAVAHRATLMAGRTLMQQAVPITFGYKAAVWLSGLTFAAERLRRAETEALALQFGGAAGTLAALGADGLKVRAALARRLKLTEAPVTWHAERGRILDIAAALAGLSGACAKIATDVILMMQTEVGEVLEPAAEGKGGSSAMPHKRNPVGSIAVRANHRRIAGLTSIAVGAMEQEHERAAGGWAAEWETLREMFCLAGGSIERIANMLGGLEVDAAQMRRNLDDALGLPMAESLAVALTAAVGKPEAQRLVGTASRAALASGRPLAETAVDDAGIAAHLSVDEIAEALDSNRYLGSAEAMIDAAVAEARREMEKG
jgi:3-carboxy-cis,cis-muconate cycloisomerase